MAEARTGSGGTRGRSGGVRPPAGSSRRRRGASPAAGDADTTQGGPSPTSRAASPVCPVAFCPVGMALSFAEAARPEVVQHLLAAGHELMLAVKAMVDARAEQVAGGSGLEHISIQ